MTSIFYSGSVREQLLVAQCMVETVLTSKPTNPFSPQFCLAGGFVRDLVLGKPFKDIDVAVPSRFKNGAVTWTTTPGDEYENSLVKSLGRACIKGNHFEFLERDLSPAPSSIVLYHSVGLSNAFFENGELVLDDTFLRDATEGVIRWNPKCYRKPKQADIKYMQRIHLKYPEFRLELPEVDEEGTF